VNHDNHATTAILERQPSTTSEWSVGSLFSGIGGIDLGLERAGMNIAWQSEIDPFACAVLERRWPDVPNLGDITKIEWSNVPRVDLICGGFPCQDISSAHTAAERRGLRGQKSGLWRYYRDAVEALRPAYVLVENVAQWKAWVPEVRADLADLGYASLPVVLHAGSFGAPHKRARVFLVADADGNGEPARAVHEEASRLRPVPVRGGDWGHSEPDHVRVDDGLPDRVDRLRALGNAVVPQLAEFIGRCLTATAKRPVESAENGSSGGAA